MCYNQSDRNKTDEIILKSSMCGQAAGSKAWCAVTIKLPEEVNLIINTLQYAGHEAYAVGGCVRDSVLGREPKDWDICTSALPEQIMLCFDGRRVIETGLMHGTITLMLNQKPFEITTFRADGLYSDNRRPDKVEFISELSADLARRDFTINALAYSPRTGIVDYFGGMGDIKRGVISCVGDAGSRFREDALRIMRALRFAAQLGFSIGGETARALHENRMLLSHIAAERITAELDGLLLGDRIRDVLSEYIDVIEVFIPELTESAGFWQNNSYHCYDVLNHALYSVEGAPKDLVVRLALLLHDIGKPGCYSEEGGTGHFYGHAKASADMARDILTRLKYDADTIKAVTALVLYHDCEIKDEKQIKRWLNKLGEALFRRLIEVKKADALAQTAHIREKKTNELSDVLAKTDEIIGSRQCFSLKALAVNGSDLIAAGIPEGKSIGVILNLLLDMVIDGKAGNNKAVLLGIAERISMNESGGAGDERSWTCRGV